MEKRWRYHKVLAPEGRLLAADAPDPEEEGWVDTPAAFDPKYVAPTVVPGDPADDAKMRSAKAARKLYPSTRYNRVGEALPVATAEEDAALDPAVWKNTPDPAAFGDAPPLAPQAASAPVVPSAPAPVLTQAEQDAAARKLAEQAQELHNTSIDVIKEKLDECPDVTFIEKVKQMEALNDEPRISLIRYLDKRIADLRAA